MLELVTKTLLQVMVTFSHTWPYLGLSVLVAAALKVHVEPARLRVWLARHQRASVIGAIGLAVLTPLCSCGTMALGGCRCGDRARVSWLACQPATSRSANSRSDRGRQRRCLVD